MGNENISDKGWYAALDDHNRTQILSNSNVVEFDKGETVIKQGVLAGQISYLEKGMVKLACRINNRSVTFKILANHAFIGLMCVFAKREFDFSAIAITPATVRMIDRTLFEEAIRTNGDFAVSIVHEMSIATNKIVTDLIGLSQKNADGAICTVLLELSVIFNSSRFQIPLSRTEFADTVGYSKESVINCLSSLQQQGIIKVSGKTIEIIDKERLESIAAYG